jgi:hypothetical protein
LWISNALILSSINRILSAKFTLQISNNNHPYIFVSALTLSTIAYLLYLGRNYHCQPLLDHTGPLQSARLLVWRLSMKIAQVFNFLDIKQHFYSNFLTYQISRKYTATPHTQPISLIVEGKWQFQSSFLRKLW